MLKEWLDGEAEPKKTKGLFLISEVGNCDRKILARLKGVPRPPISRRVGRILDNGTDVHTRILRRLHALGLVITSEIPIPENDLFRGRADAIILVPGKPTGIVEIKSISPKVFGMEKPLANHIQQLQLYMHFLRISKGILLYENKATQELREFVIGKDLDELERIFGRFKRIQRVLEEGVTLNSIKCARTWCDCEKLIF